jgi:molybdopterin synthase sulfur carrier subunit
MNVRLVGYGIAKEILRERNLDFEFSGATIKDLKTELILRFPDFESLRSISFAIGEEYRKDDYPIQPEDEIIIIPPVSGG